MISICGNEQTDCTEDAQMGDDAGMIIKYENPPKQPILFCEVDICFFIDFDMNKLKWINSQYIKKLDTKQLTELCLPFLQEAYDLSDKSEAWIEKLVEVHRDHISCGDEIVEQVKLFFEDEIHLEEEAIEFMKDEAIPNTLAVFKSKVAELAEEDFKQDQIFACIKATQKEAKARGKMLYMPLRIATTGIMHMETAQRKKFYRIPTIL